MDYSNIIKLGFETFCFLRQLMKFLHGFLRLSLKLVADRCVSQIKLSNCETVVLASCASNQFSCGSNHGGCIPSTYRCDGDRDCTDGKDENNCGEFNLDFYYVA